MQLLTILLPLLYHLYSSTAEQPASPATPSPVHLLPLAPPPASAGRAAGSTPPCSQIHSTSMYRALWTALQTLLRQLAIVTACDAALKANINHPSGDHQHSTTAALLPHVFAYFGWFMHAYAVQYLPKAVGPTPVKPGMATRNRLSYAE